MITWQNWLDERTDEGVFQNAMLAGTLAASSMFPSYGHTAENPPMVKKVDQPQLEAIKKILAQNNIQFNDKKIYGMGQAKVSNSPNPTVQAKLKQSAQRISAVKAVNDAMKSTGRAQGKFKVGPETEASFFDANSGSYITIISTDSQNITD
jgi:hypothetical protein